MIQNLKEKIREYVLQFIKFVKSDPTLLKIRDKIGQFNPFLKEKFFVLLGGLVGLLILFFLSYAFFWQAPGDFPPYSIADISQGEKLSQIADDLESQHMIISSLWMKVFVISIGGQRRIIAGDYYFEHPVNLFTVIQRILKGDFGLTQIRTVIPEGLNSSEMAKVIGLTLPKFDQGKFASLAKQDEGYLFPDTYFFAPNQKPEEIISMMREEFARQIAPYQADIDKFGHSLKDDITVASIIEDEAKNIDDKRIIAGIIWKRLKAGMPLQVDSTLRYTTGKPSSQLTTKELEDKSNSYNTYANKGLPPTPISNPGIDAIRAAITPTNTKYLYFLSDKNGKIHYAETFEQHKKNRELYLN